MPNRRTKTNLQWTVGSPVAQARVVAAPWSSQPSSLPVRGAFALVECKERNTRPAVGRQAGEITRTGANLGVASCVQRHSATRKPRFSARCVIQFPPHPPQSAAYIQLWRNGRQDGTSGVEKSRIPLTMPWNDTRPWLKDPATRFKAPPDPAVLARLHDAHCHPSDDDSFTAELLRTVKTGHLVRT